jgi:hypothetical protein
MHLDQPVDRDLSVDGRRIEALVAEELLDVADVGPARRSMLDSPARRATRSEVAGRAPRHRRPPQPRASNHALC